ncbi:hypothetical protein [Leptospira borgpetersenii]|uniref:Transposase, IS116/IS110/IS902 domain protein n=2 Tax=Leptospira borgpetersenii TaxID=174 RepID=M6BTU6_LEPBO|nr:hypothetical protein [Leptospira borgpetersenii]AMX57136.1 transposase [Leptospira borgpetersenii serovar Hardjo]AYR07464.1 hypothetical protein D1609_01730 [Leptospira borgpetersenii serovar Hardjo-bovis]EMJ81941.1 transposase, IS116/IS110/IS902 domain protein [Leptospira borgpetersenii serovar Hardjo-bovis str. Sponselee]EMO61721.1 transposase, IS116/IS110/IS902 domain protein [Leptospira borgpetersenii serovar Pomona str. 200901868]AMX60367.1 transposase [Leptospira borgpetersenii serova
MALRIDISGDTVCYGKIVNRGCNSIQRMIVQAAWSPVHCQHNGKIKELYEKLCAEKM